MADDQRIEEALKAFENTSDKRLLEVIGRWAANVRGQGSAVSFDDLVGMTLAEIEIGRRGLWAEYLKRYGGD